MANLAHYSGAAQARPARPAKQGGCIIPAGVYYRGMDDFKRRAEIDAFVYEELTVSRILVILGVIFAIALVLDLMERIA